jgi:hypothetical protein
MSFLGADGGNPGSIKRDGDEVIAHYHDDVWIDDIERACEMMCGSYGIERASH